MNSEQIYIKNKTELDLMRKSGEISAQALKKVIETAGKGVNLLELEKVATDEIIRFGGESAFKTVSGYNYTTCLTVNQEVVHGIPRDIVLKKGDLISIDLGTVYKGWFTDTAWSICVGGGTNNFLEVGEKALWNAIDKAKEGNFIGDISEAIQTTVEGAGFRVIRSLIGHGVGKKLHEAPEVPGIGKAGTGVKLKMGMTLAIEVIYTESTSEVVLAEDNWTLTSANGSLGGLFEMSVIVGKERAEVITDWRSIN
ncbi:MAG: Methionine aminopeptidase [Candidatus Daviesbacteria bacterium GW2011_GWA2_38_24]|uniref:Methionine aminopeptidase n=1 Tax=Candidatus Daviesbacteria bacterium GW2011_GWA2_38_24 TaxID=1618422 RepID=A0A0G0JWB6_9BACT|nr:MAG: Methionine aminopeptidase [Candidatus Daviesbacteria bacterium GW2011_GWA2_38_24]OGE24513.1 MAG: type I methionyl aminopeptidase [Candidatus Daviesbacteria bacterium RIFCSPHIGHO2_01_FULL_38_8]